MVIRCPKNFSDVLNQSHLSNLSLSPDFKIAFRTIVMCLRWADGDFEKMIISFHVPDTKCFRYIG